MEASPRRVDLRKILAQRYPSLYARLPGFLLRVMAWIIHQDKINVFLQNNEKKGGIDFVKGVLDDLQLTFSVQGTRDWVDRKGRDLLFASNHPLGGLDGLILAHLIGQKYGEVKIVVNDLLMALPPIHALFVPLNRYGTIPRHQVNHLRDVFTSSAPIVVFPAGQVSRRAQGRVIDAPWGKFFLKKAVQYERDVVPVYIQGRNSALFYNLSSFRKLARIPLNLEMFLLPREIFNKQGAVIDIYFGSSIPHSTFDASRPMEGWTEDIRKRVYNLKKEFE